jgi:hypothetical protein
MTHKGRTNYDAIVRNLFTAGRKPFYPGLRQAVENSFDARLRAEKEGEPDPRLSIEIEIIGRKQPDGAIMIADNGKGFGSAEIDAFHSIYFTSKEGDASQIGKHGSGRLFLLEFAKRIVVYTKSKEFPKLSRFSFGRDDVLKVVKNGTWDFNREEVARAPKGVSVGKTGSVIILEGVDWEKVPTKKEIVETFSDHLKPSIARTVTVDGQRLKDREIIGEAIDESVVVPYLSGIQDIELFLPQQLKRGEEVMIGGYNQICSLREIFHQLNEFDKSLVPPVLMDRSIIGVIYIPDINKVRSHTSDNLDPEFFSSERKDLREAFLRFLDEEVRPRVEAAFDTKEKRDEIAEQKKYLAGILDVINPAFDFDPMELKIHGEDLPGKPEKKQDEPGPRGLCVNTKYISMLPGDQFIFHITDTTGTSGDFLWDASASGGRIHPKSGLEVKYTAGNQLSPENTPFTLVVWDKKDPSINATIKIFIAQDIPVMITPQIVQITRGDSHPFRLRNANLTSCDIVWSLKNPKRGVSILRSEALTTRVFVAENAPLGVYELVAKDRAKKKVYTASFEVMPQPDNRGAFIRVEDIYYRIEAAVNIHMVVERIKEGSSVVKRGHKKRIDLLRIGFNHPILRNIRESLQSSGKGNLSEIMTQKVVQYILLAHLRGLVDDGEETFDEHTFISRLVNLEQALMGKKHKK